MTTTRYTSDSFRYPELSPTCIRLLKFLPSQPDQALNLELVNNVPYVEEETSYTAISYCWGDSKDTLPVVLSGTRFIITRNLYDALVAITKHHGELVGTYLWADAICINQSDDVEKGHQVSQMWRIFHSARLVVAWLGLEDETTETLFTAVETIRSEHSTPQQRQDYRFRVRAIEEGWPNGPSPAERLVERPYFSRVWMITECVQATELVFLCGKFTCSPQPLTLYLEQLPDQPVSTFSRSLIELLPYRLEITWLHAQRIR